MNATVLAVMSVAALVLVLFALKLLVVRWLVRDDARQATDRDSVEHHR